MDIGGGCGGSASRYEAAFREREIDERVFPSLTQEDLTEIGVGPVRITGQLIDAVTGRHLWADRFERDLTDVFALQDEVTAAVVSAIQPKLLQTEIACARYFTTKELAAYAAGTSSIAQPSVWAEAMRLLLDVTTGRLSAMGEAGLDVQVLSLNAPGIQAEKDASAAVSRAKAVNDLLAETIANNPDRFAGFAALPRQNPQAAARELERVCDGQADTQSAR